MHAFIFHAASAHVIIYQYFNTDARTTRHAFVSFLSFVCAVQVSKNAVTERTSQRKTCTKGNTRWRDLQNAVAYEVHSSLQSKRFHRYQ